MKILLIKKPQIGKKNRQNKSFSRRLPYADKKKKKLIFNGEYKL